MRHHQREIVESVKVLPSEICLRNFHFKKFPVCNFRVSTFRKLALRAHGKKRERERELRERERERKYRHPVIIISRNYGIVQIREKWKEPLPLAVSDVEVSSDFDVLGISHKSEVMTTYKNKNGMHVWTFASTLMKLSRGTPEIPKQIIAFIHCALLLAPQNAPLSHWKRTPKEGHNLLFTPQNVGRWPHARQNHTGNIKAFNRYLWPSTPFSLHTWPIEIMNALAAVP